eukprot:6206906-Pleurochrysis_carterae.AAC.1
MAMKVDDVLLPAVHMMWYAHVLDVVTDDISCCPCRRGVRIRMYYGTVCSQAFLACYVESEVNPFVGRNVAGAAEPLRVDG